MMLPQNNPLHLGRALIVDDEAELVALLCETLTGQGFETTGYTSCEEALAALQTEEFDLLLTDLAMPGMDGIAFTKAALEIDPGLVGIIMTGHGTVQTAVEAMKTGAFDYILKPFKRKELMPVLLRAMDVRRLKLDNIQLRETVAIYELAKTIAFPFDVTTILNKAADAVLQQCKADEVSILLPTPGNGRELYMAVARGNHQDPFLGKKVPVGEGIAGWVAQNRESLILNGKVDDPRFKPVNPRDEIRCAISLPMLSGGQLVGVLNVNITSRRRSLTLGHVKALSILVSIIAPILESSRLYAQVVKAEEALRTSEEKYRSIFENTVEGIFRTTGDGRFIEVNPAMARIHGYASLEQMVQEVTDIGRQLFVISEDRERYLSLLREDGIVRGFETKICRKDGTIIWTETNSRAVKDAAGKILYHEGTSEDITERVLVEKQFKKLTHDLGERVKELDCLAHADAITRKEGLTLDRLVQEIVQIIPPAFQYPEVACARIRLYDKTATSPDFKEAVWKQSADIKVHENKVGAVEVHYTDERPECDDGPFLKEEKTLIDAIGHRLGKVVERLQTEKALRASEEKYRSIFENAQEGMFQSTLDGRLISVNPALAEMAGFSSPEEMMATVTDLAQQLYVNSADRDRFMQLLREHGSVSGFEAKARTKGKVDWFSLSARLVRDELGVPRYCEGNMSVITPRKEAERQSRLTRLRQKAMLDLYQMADASIDQITRFVVQQCVDLTESELCFIGFVNEDEVTMHNHQYSAKAVEACTVDTKLASFSIKDAGLWAEAIRQRQTCIVNDYQDSNPYKRGYPEGHAHLTRFMGIPIIDKGSVVVVAAVANKQESYDDSDVFHVTMLLKGMWSFIQKKEAEQALIESEQKYRSIFNNAVEGIFRSVPEDRFISVNPAMARMYGYASEEEMLTNVTSIRQQLWTNPKQMMPYVNQLEKEGMVRGFEHQARRKDGSTVWVSLSSKTVRDAEGKILRYEGIVEDITYRKQAEEELRQAVERLRKSLAGTIEALSLTVEKRDPYTAGHQKRVSILARRIAQEIGLDKDAIDSIRMAGAIHDIGKMAVPAEILSKPIKLTDAEMNLIRVHSQSGYDILKEVGLPYPIAEIVLQHHERMDGSGYPQGLKDGQILLEAQIVAIADVVEAISSHRPYRPARGVDAALEEIERNKAVLYGAEIVEVCLSLFREKDFNFESGSNETKNFMR